METTDVVEGKREEFGLELDWKGLGREWFPATGRSPQIATNVKYLYIWSLPSYCSPFLCHSLFPFALWLSTGTM